MLLSYYFRAKCPTLFAVGTILFWLVVGFAALPLARTSHLPEAIQVLLASASGIVGALWRTLVCNHRHWKDGPKRGCTFPPDPEESGSRAGRKRG